MIRRAWPADRAAVEAIASDAYGSYIERPGKPAVSRRIAALYACDDAENIALYRKLGFVETGRGHQDGYDRVFMAKPLIRR